MSTATTDALLEAIHDLRVRFPQWRMGQLIANLSMAAGFQNPEAIWDIEDDQLLAAARRLIERNPDRAVDAS